MVANARLAHAEGVLSRPHRAYRRFWVLRPTSLAVSLVALVALETALVVYLGEVVRVFGQVTYALVRYLDTPASQGGDEFLGVPLYPIIFGSIPPLDYRTLAIWLAASVLGVALLGKSRRIIAPLRFILIYNLVLIAGSAVYLLFAGHLGYDPEEFSRLYMRTIVVIWLVTPIFMAALSLTLPFSAVERLGLVVLSLAYDIVFSAVRYALFVWVLTRGGSVVMANLYLILGPLLDVIYFVGVFAAFLLRLTRRLDREAGFRAWS